MLTQRLLDFALVFLSTGVRPTTMGFFFTGSRGQLCMATRIKVTNGKLRQIKNSLYENNIHN